MLSGNTNTNSQWLVHAVSASSMHHPGANNSWFARDGVTHAMMMTRTGVRVVEGCGRGPYDYSKDSRDPAPKAPGLRTEKTH